MSFLINFLGIILNKLFGGKSSNTESNNSNTYEFKNTNNAMADARASVIYICVGVVAVYWIPQYLFADYMWIKMCLAHNTMVPFPLDDKKLFDLLYSVLGLGVAGAIHKLIK